MVLFYFLSADMGFNNMKILVHVHVYDFSLINEYGTAIQLKYIKLYDNQFLFTLVKLMLIR